MSENLKIFGNSDLLKLISSMQESGRIPHAIVLFGPSGVGKKTLAKYIAAQLLCYENRSGSVHPPCCKCKSCKMVMHSSHPDVITIKPSGKTSNYKMDDIRPICTDAYIAPNESDRKIYIIPDFDTTREDVQNVLLKVVEEPPSRSSFIFTATSKDCFLETIISRVISLGVTEVTNDECLQALSEAGASAEDSAAAVAAFGGNIGKCMQLINDKELQIKIDMVRKISYAIFRKDEYAFLSAFQTNDRADAKDVISMLVDVMRDACAYRTGSKVLISTAKDIAKDISTVANPQKCSVIIDALNGAYNNLNGFSAVNIVVAALCAEIKTVI